jgi:hypothetical protein
MTISSMFVVRRCDSFYRHWHDVMAPGTLQQAHTVYDRVTHGGRFGTTPEDTEYYDIFSIDPLPGWKDVQRPLIRRLHSSDLAAIEAHFLRLNDRDRHFRFFRELTDEKIGLYVRGMEVRHSLVLGAVRSHRVVGVAEAFFVPSLLRDVEVAVSVDVDLRERGLAKCLTGQIVDRAGLQGAREAKFVFLRENLPIQRVIRAIGGSLDLEDLIAIVRPSTFPSATSGEANRRLNA